MEDFKACEKTLEFLKDKTTDEIDYFIARYCRPQAECLCSKELGFKLHRPTAERFLENILVADVLLAD